LPLLKFQPSYFFVYVLRHLGAVECAMNVSSHVFHFTGSVTTCIYNEYVQRQKTYLPILLFVWFSVP